MALLDFPCEVLCRIKTTPTGVVTGIKQPPYPAWFYRQIVDDHGEVLRAGKE